VSLRVPRWFYRSLWIAIAVIGALCTLGLIMLLFGELGSADEDERALFLATGLFGAVIFVYALWRLRWPLKAPPRT